MNKNNEEVGAEERVKRLARHPELMHQIRGLLDEVENRAGGFRTADEAEDALIERVQSIGCTGLNDWAKHEAAKLKTPPPRTRRGSKKSLLGEHLRSGGVLGAWLEGGDKKSASSALPARNGRAGLFAALAARIDRLWRGRGVCPGCGQGVGALRGGG